jgi:hypothetical protein
MDAWRKRRTRRAARIDASALLAETGMSAKCHFRTKRSKRSLFDKKIASHLKTRTSRTLGWRRHDCSGASTMIRCKRPRCLGCNLAVADER